MRAPALCASSARAYNLPQGFLAENRGLLREWRVTREEWVAIAIDGKTQCGNQIVLAHT